MPEETYRAFVGRIVPNGRHGPFFFANSDLLGRVTCSLGEDREEWPELGTEVVLTGVFKKRAGWRAKNWRHVRPSEEQ